MQSSQNYRVARHRTMMLMYITWLTLSLAPAMIAPPEKAFAQGQPEMQQAMDNMVVHKTIIKKRLRTPASDDTDYRALLTTKTSSLLSEAEQVLSSLPNSKERQWIEAFVHRMRAIATMLENTAQNKNKILPKNINTVSGTPVPEGLPIQPTWPATSAVPGINPFQKPNRMMSKFPVTSPELSKVLPANEYPSDRQAVTKPAVLSKNNDLEEDELVRELENLHQEYAQRAPLENSKVLDQVPVFTTPSTSMSLESSSAKTTDMETEKTKLQAKLIQEIKEFQRLGGVMPSGVINALYPDNQKETGLVYSQNTNVEDKLKFTEAGMVDRHGIKKFSEDSNNGNKEISQTNHQNSVVEGNNPYQAEKHLPQMKYNYSFQNIHPNFHPIRPVYPNQMGNALQYDSSQIKEPYQGNLQNTIPALQKPDPYNQQKYNAMVPPGNQQIGHVPDALKQMLSISQHNFYNRHLPSGYKEYLMRHGYAPLPNMVMPHYPHNTDPKNSTLNQPPMISPYLTKQPNNYQTDMQLSDEMKRQLRDGKIVVLSDSVVRSNFETKGEKTTDTPPNKPNYDIMGAKNATITET